MTVHQRLFLVQARSDFAVFQLLRAQTGLPVCHALHYLQMATEMLGKAHAWKHGAPGNTHRAFVSFLRRIMNNRGAQKQLGYERRNEHWKQLIRKSVPLAERVEDLAPALSPDAPNPEYPWPRAAPHTSPAEYAFGIWRDLEDTPAGNQFRKLIGDLFAIGEVYL